MNEKKIPLIDLLCLKFPDILKKELFARIVCGEVIVNGEKITNKMDRVSPNSSITFRSKQYVSRGGLKLAPLLVKWNVKVKDRIFIDAGSSTGGFTDCLLQSGAAFVYAVDVGYNQLDYILRRNSRIMVCERTNIMNLTSNTLQHGLPHSAVCDLSFRSIHGAASHLLNLVTSDTLIALIKPQFEWEKPDPEFKGVIHDDRIIIQICINLIEKLYADDIYISKIALSPIRGTKGNKELFFLLKKQDGLKKDNVITNLLSLFS